MYTYISYIHYAAAIIKNSLVDIYINIHVYDMCVCLSSA